MKVNGNWASRARISVNKDLYFSQFLIWP